MAPLRTSPRAIGHVRGLLAGASRETALAVVDEIDAALPIGWADEAAVEAVLTEVDTADGRDLLAELWGVDLDRRLAAIAERAGADVDDVAAVARRLVLLIAIDDVDAESGSVESHEGGPPTAGGPDVEPSGGGDDAGEGVTSQRRGLRRLRRRRSG